MILGSTHYPLCAPILQRMLGPWRHARVRRAAGSPAASSARSPRAGCSNPQAGEGAYRFLCTGEVDAFRAVGTRFLQMPLGEVVHVELRAREAA